MTEPYKHQLARQKWMKYFENLEKYRSSWWTPGENERVQAPRIPRDRFTNEGWGKVYTALQYKHSTVYPEGGRAAFIRGIKHLSQIATDRVSMTKSNYDRLDHNILRDAYNTETVVTSLKTAKALQGQQVKNGVQRRAGGRPSANRPLALPSPPPALRIAGMVGRPLDPMADARAFAFASAGGLVWLGATRLLNSLYERRKKGKIAITAAELTKVSVMLDAIETQLKKDLAKTRRMVAIYNHPTVSHYPTSTRNGLKRQLINDSKKRVAGLGHALEQLAKELKSLKPRVSAANRNKLTSLMNKIPVLRNRVKIMMSKSR